MPCYPTKLVCHISGWLIQVYDNGIFGQASINFVHYLEVRSNETANSTMDHLPILLSDASVWLKCAFIFMKLRIRGGMVKNSDLLYISNFVKPMSLLHSGRKPPSNSSTEKMAVCARIHGTRHRSLRWIDAIIPAKYMSPRTDDGWISTWNWSG